MRSGAIVMIVLLASAAVARANTGTQLPLNQYQAGTESTTLVANGDFEAVTAGDADGWAETSTGMQAATPVNTQGQGAAFGNFAAQALSGVVDPTRYSRTVSLTPNTDYRISAYLWNFGAATDLALAEAMDGTTLVKNIALEPIASDAGSGANGYFVYSDVFNSGALTSVTLEVEFDQDTAGARPAVVAQFDNVAVTPNSSFAPPSLIPEPGSLSLLALGGLAVLRRRGKN